jgi:hypothetical protein
MAGKWVCCSLQIDTNFCPNCGVDRRSANPLGGLLKHLEVEMQRAERELKAVAGESRSAAHKTRILGKWTAWHDALKAMLLEQK